LLACDRPRLVWKSKQKKTKNTKKTRKTAKLDDVRVQLIDCILISIRMQNIVIILAKD